MTSTRRELEGLKQDTRGRARVSLRRREALLDEFEKSGASGMKFARLVGIKYSTFANLGEATAREARGDKADAVRGIGGKRLNGECWSGSLV